MNRTRLSSLLLCFAVFGFAFHAISPMCRADDAGLETLNQAMELKFSSQSIPDFDKVIRLCEKAEEEGLSGENLEFCHQILGATHLLKGKIVAELIIEQFGTIREWRQIRKLALDDLNAAVKYLPDQSAAYLFIARLNLLPEGDRDIAKESVEKAVQYAEDDPVTQADAMLLKANMEEDREKRVVLLREAVKLIPDSPEALTAMGGALFDAEQADEAIETLKKALELEPDSPVTLGMMIRILSSQKKYDEALKVLETLDKITPNSPFAMLQRMDIYLELKNFDEALKIINTLRDRAPGDPLILLQRAAVYAEKKDYNAAMKDADSALRLAEENSEMEQKVIFFKASLWAQQEDYAKAIDFIKKILDKKKDKDHVKEKYQEFLIQLYLKAQVNTKVLEITDKFLAQNPESLEMLRFRGDALLGLGRHKEAIAEYEKLVKITPEDEGVLNNLSWVLATTPEDSLRDGKRALELAQKSCELTDYKMPHILSTLAAAYAETGDFDEALKWISKGCELAVEAEYDQAEHLEQEKASYEAKKPWREKLEEDQPDPSETQETKKTDSDSAEEKSTESK
ncbi:MAG: tetratricopeptide repeat protein [Planctomycetaceae bacterium]|jgi:tetratricopeptide (TPR) repeat protein|nr:tetratricopeptide repeat protein [Planctomycetaceae bacterium]